jgi:hypothetical protein
MPANASMVNFVALFVIMSDTCKHVMPRISAAAACWSYFASIHPTSSFIRYSLIANFSEMIRGDSASSDTTSFGPNPKSAKIFPQQALCARFGLYAHFSILG